MSRPRRWPRPGTAKAAVHERAPAATCPCGKYGYLTRKDAKRTMKAIPAAPDHRGHLDAYQCRLTDRPLWHIGHLPPAVVQGTASRDQIIVTPRPPGRRR